MGRGNAGSLPNKVPPKKHFSGRSITARHLTMTHVTPQILPSLSTRCEKFCFSLSLTFVAVKVLCDLQTRGRMCVYLQKIFGVDACRTRGRACAHQAEMLWSGLPCRLQETTQKKGGGSKDQRGRGVDASRRNVKCVARLLALDSNATRVICVGSP